MNMQSVYICAVLVAAVSASCRRRWCKLSEQCLNQTSALRCWKSPSEIPCLFKWSPLPGDLVAQWSERDASCCLFDFQSVCRDIRLTSVSVESLVGGRCRVYRVSSLSRCSDSLSVASHFVGVWLAGGGSRLDNLVCQSDPSDYRLMSENVALTEDGAELDGSSSYASTADVGGVVSSDGFTWLMRLWEYSSPTILWFNNAAKSFASTQILSNDSRAWIDIAVTKSTTSCNLYYNGSLVANLTSNFPKSVGCFIIQVGRRFPSNFLRSTIRAVAIANVSMTLQQMTDFFSALPAALAELNML